MEESSISSRQCVTFSLGEDLTLVQDAGRVSAPEEEIGAIEE